MNIGLKRFIESTLPSKVIYGLVLIFLTYFLGWKYGLLMVIVYSIVDITGGYLIDLEKRKK